MYLKINWNFERHLEIISNVSFSDTLWDNVDTKLIFHQQLSLLLLSKEQWNHRFIPIVFTFIMILQGLVLFWLLEQLKRLWKIKNILLFTVYKRNFKPWFHTCPKCFVKIGYSEQCREKWSQLFNRYQWPYFVVFEKK